MGANKHTVSDRVWQGILIMYRNPEVINFITPLPMKLRGNLTQTEDIGEYRANRKRILKDMKLKQRDIDAVLRAVSWAEAKEFSDIQASRSKA